jgi:hypothetical protein
MARWSSLKDAKAALLVSVNWRLWLLQFASNAVLFLAFVWWLHLADAHWWQLLFTVLLMVAIIACALILHGGTLNYFLGAHQEKDAAKGALLVAALKEALKHLAAIAVWAAIFFILRGLIGKLDQYAVSFPGYLRSEFPVWLRRMISEPALDNIYGGLVALLRWVILPGLLLPFALFCADRGFRGLIALRDCGRTIRSFMYWLVLLIASILSVYCIGLIMDWKLDPKTATLSAEKTSLAFRLLFSYLLGIFSWFLVCSMLGRRQLGGAGQPVAQPK